MVNYNKDILVVENSISVEEQDALERFVTHHSFPWFFYPGTILPTDVTYTNDCIIQKGLNPPQFSHYMSVENSPNINLVAPIFNCLAEIFQTNIQILKIKFNLLTQINKKTHHWPHADIDDYENKVMTGLYYVNNSDGPTYLFNKFAPKKNDNIIPLVKVDPEKGKMVIFDSRRLHSSSSPVVNNLRTVLNVVFKIPKD
jgi:hypothetical protein